MGISPDSLKMWVLLGKRNNPAKPLLLGKSNYYLEKGIFRGEIMPRRFFHIQKTPKNEEITLVKNLSII